MSKYFVEDLECFRNFKIFNTKHLDKINTSDYIKKPNNNNNNNKEIHEKNP